MVARDRSAQQAREWRFCECMRAAVELTLFIGRSSKPTLPSPRVRLANCSTVRQSIARQRTACLSCPTTTTAQAARRTGQSAPPPPSSIPDHLGGGGGRRRGNSREASSGGAKAALPASVGEITALQNSHRGSCAILSAASSSSMARPSWVTARAHRQDTGQRQISSTAHGRRERRQHSTAQHRIGVRGAVRRHCCTLVCAGRHSQSLSSFGRRAG